MKTSLSCLTRTRALPPQRSAITSFAYGYNLGNQRTNITLADNSSWSFGYDFLGQVTSGSKKWSDGATVAGQQFGYRFDDIGNRTSTTNNGHAATYGANSLNQYTNRTVPSFVSLLGTAHSNATVTLWGDNGSFSQTTRKGEYFHGGLSVTNTSAAVWLTATNLAVLQNGTNADYVSSVVGSTLVPQTPQAFLYDLDGNLTNDGVWAYTWDGENRLIAMETLASVPAGAQQRLEFTYDHQSRRIQKKVFTGSAGNWTLSSDLRFVYDNWNLIAVLDSDLGVLTSFTWGSDLSGSQHGAGGVGGLLSLTVHTGTNAGTCHPCYDGNGNVMALVNSADGTIAARYEYGPFGELIRGTGPVAKANPFRFSTKFQDDETGLLYYGHRYYDPITGRWNSRDPIREWGGRNLFAMVSNDLVGNIDFRGLFPAPYLPPGTVLTQEAEVGGRGGNRTISAMITGTFSSQERETAIRALCLVNALIGPGLHPVPWTDTYWANIFPSDVHGTTFEFDGIMAISPMPTPKPRKGNRWVVISREGYPTASSGSALLTQLRNFGATLAHESDHYDTGSDEETAKARVDTQLLEMFQIAKARRLKCVLCTDSPSLADHWRVENMLEFFACKCGIKVR